MRGGPAGGAGTAHPRHAAGGLCTSRPAALEDASCPRKQPAWGGGPSGPAGQGQRARCRPWAVVRVPRRPRWPKRAGGGAAWRDFRLRQSSTFYANEGSMAAQYLVDPVGVGWGASLKGRDVRVPHVGPIAPLPTSSGPQPPVRPRVTACQAQGHRLSGPGGPRPGRTELCSHSPPGRRCQGRGALVCHPSVRSLVVTLAPSAPTAS